MATDNFTFNGKHSFNDMGLISTLVSRPLFAEPKTAAEDLPGTDGEADFSLANPAGRLCFKPRIIELECHFASETESTADYYEKMATIAKWLAEGEKCELRFDDEPNIVYFANAANLFNTERITDFSGSFPLVFKCDPFRYASFESVCEGGGTVKCVNSGYYCGFTLYITGKTEKGYKIKNNRFPDKILSVNFPLTEEGVITVNTADMTVTHNGISILSKCGGDFFELAPGENKISITGGSGVSAEIFFTARHL